MSDAAAFVAEACEPSPTSRISTAELHAAYSDWCEARNEVPRPIKSFGQQLTAVGYKAIRPGGKPHRQGLRLKRKLGPVGIVRPTMPENIETRTVPPPSIEPEVSAEVSGVYLDGKPEPPAHLAESTAAWWRSLVEEYDLTEAHLRLITMACEQWDIGQRAYLEVHRDGPTVAKPSGLCPHPGVQIHAAATRSLQSILKQLGLDEVGGPG